MSIHVRICVSARVGVGVGFAEFTEMNLRSVTPLNFFLTLLTRDKETSIFTPCHQKEFSLHFLSVYQCLVKRGNMLLPTMLKLQ